MSARASKVRFLISGTGNQVGIVGLVDKPTSGRVSALLARQHTGGGATAVDLFVMESRDDTRTDPTLVGQEALVAKSESATVTPSDTVAFVSGPIGSGGWHPSFINGLQLGYDVTASGAWTIEGYVEVERGG